MEGIQILKFGSSTKLMKKKKGQKVIRNEKEEEL